MRNIYALFIAIGITISSIADAFAAHVDSTRVMQSALGFFSALTHTPTERLLSEGVSIAYRACAAETAGSHAGAVCFYVINVGQKGFVMLSGDDRITPVLGYSYESSFNTKNMPENLRNWLEARRKEISSALGSGTLFPSPGIIQQWNHLPEIGATMSVVVQPLLQTTWDQNAYYNQYCPEDMIGPNGHAYAGCVATAMAQIIRYWEWPASGFDSHSYTCAYGTQSVDFSTANYNYSDMPNSIQGSSSLTQIDAVAMLTYHCGVSVDMDYGPDGSGAYSAYVPYALFHYFAYPPGMSYQSKSSYSSSEWNNLLRNELNNGRPILYSGGEGSGGHSFICDGYDNNGTYHFNWGWSGNFNGYFALNALTPGPFDFSDGQTAAIGISADGSFLRCSQNGLNVSAPIGGYSEVKTVDVRGHSLNGNITVTAGNGFVVGVDGNTFSNSVTIPAQGGRLYVKYTPTLTSPGTQNANVVLVSGSVRDTVFCYGTAVEEVCLPPRDLTGTHMGNQVHLSWSEPVEYVSGSPASVTLSWDSTVMGVSASIGSDLTLCMMQRFDVNDLAPYHHYLLNSISFIPSAQGTSFRLVAYKGGNYNNGYHPGTQIVNQEIPTASLVHGTWNTVQLNSPVLVDATEELWFGFVVYTTGNNGNVICLSTGNLVPGKGNVLGVINGHNNGTGNFYWEPVTLSYNFPIKGMLEQIPANVVRYDVYRNASQIGSSTSTSYIDNSPLTSNCEYTVTAVWDNGCSQSVSVTVNPPAVSLPAVTTGDISNITISTATCEGAVTSTGGSTVTARGICWSTTQNPTVDGSHSTNGSGLGTFTSNITGLTPNTTYYVRAYAMNNTGTAYGVQKSFKTSCNSVTVSITGNSTVSYGQSTTLTASGASTYHWSTNENTASITVSPTTTTTYTVTGTNSYGCTATASKTVTVNADLPTVTTIEVFNITTLTAVCSCEVTSDGGSTVTVRGVCLSTSPIPTINDSHTADSSGTGSFASFISGLTPNTAYYVRAYATSNMGTAYGEVLSFTTAEVSSDGQPCPNYPTVTDIDGNVYNTVQIGDQCWTRENLRTTRYANGTEIALGSGISETTAYRYYPNNNSDNVATYGYLYNWAAVMHGAPSTDSIPSGVQGLCPAGWHVPSIWEWSQLTFFIRSQDQYFCSNNSLYFAKSLASITGWSASSAECGVGNDPGTNNATNFSVLAAGYYYGDASGFGNYTYLWSTSESEDNNVYSYGFCNDQAFAAVISNTYKTLGLSVRCLLDEDNTSSLPTVITHQVATVTSNSATCGGNVTDDGGAAVTARGVCWSTSPNPTISDNHTSDGSGLGLFTSNITGLMPNTMYYVRAYATNSVGTTYGEQRMFTTSCTNFLIADTVAVCGNYTWNGETYTESGDYVQIFQTAYGCDSVVTLHLTVYHSWTCDTTCVACDSFTWHGVMYTETPVVAPIHTYQTAHGCDSVVTLHLHIIHSKTVTLDSVVCANEVPITWNGLTFTEAGTQTLALVSAEGCDSVVVMTLQVNGCGPVVDEKSCPAAPTVTDHEGNVYATVQIGDQCWMRDNLRTTTSPSTGTYLVNTTLTYTGKQARWYNNDSATYAPMNYGLLYNWNAAVDTFNTVYGETSVNADYNNAMSVSFTGQRRGICPTGWHLPSNAEWTVMTNYVRSQSEYTCGGNNIAKSLAATTGWNTGTDTCEVGNNQSGNNATGFSALPVGGYMSTGYYPSGDCAPFWSATEFGSSQAYNRLLLYYNADVVNFWSNKSSVFSIRCLRDAGIATPDTPIYDVQTINWDYPATGCALYDEHIQVTVKNMLNTAIPANKVIVHAIVNGTHLSQLVSEPFASEEVKQITFSTPYNFSAPGTTTAPTSNKTFNYVVYTDVLDETPVYRSNDTILGQIISIYTAPLQSSYTYTGEYTHTLDILQPNDRLAMTGTAAQITKYLFYSDEWNVTPLTLTPTTAQFYTTPVLYDSVTYWVAAVSKTSNCTTRRVPIYINVEVPTYVIDSKSCPAAPTVTDHEGNVYATVLIGNQCWMRDNLRATTSPSTGTYLIPAAGIGSTYTGKQARWYNDDSTTYAPMNYGLLYNWNAAVDTFNIAYGETSVNTTSSNAVSVTFDSHRRGICPVGWHLPSDGEWTEMTDYVSSQSEYVCGDTNINIAKALASTEGWSSNTSACAVGNNQSGNNATGFGALPAGSCSNSSFYFANNATYFWSSSEYNNLTALYRSIVNYAANVASSKNLKNCGFSVRCLRDSVGGPTSQTQPTVTTEEATDITSSSATLNGTVANPDNVTITAQGFQWKASQGGTYSVVNASGATMSYNLTGLAANTSYTYRAFATTEEGTNYGEEVSFTTPCASINVSFSATACDSYAWNDETYTESGDYVQIFQTAYDCDSVVTLRLTVYHSWTCDTTCVACDSFTWHGVMYTETPVVAPIHTYQTAHGCDSVVTLHLHIIHSKTVTMDSVVCANELPFTWNAVTFTEAGTQTLALVSAEGCDSVVVMTLHVANSQTLATPQISVDNAAICNGGQVMLTVSNPDNNAVYTWFRNGSVIPGAVNATIIENPTTADGDPTNYVYTVKAEILASACTSSSQISPNAVVTVIPDPVVSVSVDGNTTLCEGGSASLHANVTPASGNYSYQWYKDNVLIEPATSDYHVVSEAVRETAYHYSVVVSGLPGCTATAQAPAIAFVPDPYITVTASNHISCVGGSATLTAAVECGVTNANFTYYWYKSNPNTSSPELIGMSDELTIAGNEPAGNYSYYMIAAADVYGCRTTSNIVNYTVIADPIVTITVANGYPQTVCSGGESMIKAYVAGGYGDASYQWYKNGNLLVGETYQTLELHNLAYGVNDVYTVEVSQTGAGCSSSASAAINTLVTVAPSYTIDIVGFGNVYEGSELTLNATVNGVLSGDVLAYQWYKVTNGVASAVYGATSSTCIVSGLIPGNSYEYYVTVASTISGCSCVSASVPVTVLPATVVPPTVTTDSVSNIGTDAATCGGNVTSDGGATVTARGICWSTSPNPMITDSHTSDSSGTGMFTSEITGLTPNTTYHVRAYATNSEGTSYGEEMNFTTHCPTIKITGPSCSFIFGNITLVASGADNYIWSTGDSSATITVAQSNTTTYSVTGTDSYGCVGTDSMLVAVYPSFNPTEVGTGLSDIEVNCNNSTVTLCANVVVNSTKDYIVESIPYNPPFGFAEGTRIFNAGDEDSWGASIHLPFNFSFYGLCYSNVYPGSNSVLTFNYPPQQCNWHYTDSIPNTNLFANTIFACYRDLDIGNLGIDGGVFDTVYGEFPNRCFKLSFNNVGLYSDNSLSNTFSSMIILHEGTNIIDIYLRDAPTIVSWNNGNGVLGLQNRTGDKGITPPGRNTGPWTAHEEAWRFIPVADSNYTVTWYLGNTALSTGIIVGTGDTITVSPQESTDYTARLQYTDDCGNEFFLFQTCHVTVNKEGPIVTVNASQNELCEGDNTTLLATGADTYLWSTGNATDSITVSPTSTTTYYVTGYTGQTCSSVDSITVIVWESFDTLFNITVCDSYIWNDSVYTSSGDYVQHFQTIHGCDSTVTLHLTVNHSDATDMYATSCDSYTWNGVTYHESGDYLLYLTNAVGCDSIVTMHLTINYSDTIEFSATACNNYNWNGITYTESGDYVANMTNASGCDLVVVLHLTVNHSDTTDLYASACDSYSWNGATYYASGDYVHTFTNVAGCDSVVTLHLTINLSVHSDLFVSDCESYTWNGTTYTLSGDHVQTFTSVNGCDSVVTMHLVLNNTDALECDTTVCDIFTWNDMTYSASGDYVQTFINKNGCDSVVTLHLTVNHSCSTILQATACDIYTWNGVTYTESGDYPLYLTNAVGCDSIVTLHLTINYSDTIEFSATACNSYNWNGVTYTESGDYTTYMTNASGCNLLLVLHLTVNHSDTTNLYASACDSYFWNGTTYYVSGNYVHAFTNAAGCDSVVTLHLTISSTDHTNVMEEACDSYTWNGEVYTESGVYTQTFTNAAGCDSVVTLHLTVSNTSHTDISEEACDSYTWNGEVYTESGLYTETFTNVNGCDSVVTLHLTVNHSDTIDFYATACDSYNWNDETYTESGDYTHLMTSSTGCNLVAMLHLTINHSEITEFDISTEDSCYVWNGTTYCSSGDYIQTMQTEDGCDSLVILHLTITVGIDDHELTSSMILYPNPTDNIVNVKLSIDQMPEISDVEIQLYDMYGKFLQTVPVKDEFTSIDLSSYASGVYFVKAVVDGQVMAIRKAVRR